MADEIDVGGIVATIRIDADKVDSTLDSAVKGLNNLGESGKKAVDRVEELQSKTNGLAPILDKIGKGSQGAADGISKVNSKVKAGSLEKYDAQLQTLNSDYEAQKKIVNQLGAQLDYLVEDYYKLEQSLGRGDTFDPAELYPQESAQLDKEMAKLSELETKINQITAARKKAAEAAVDAAAKQASAAEDVVSAEGATSSAMNKQASSVNKTNMAFDAGATALRAVTSAAGGTVSKLGYLGTELMYLKRSMQAAATTGSMMASVLSFGVMAAVTLVTTAITALQEKEEKRQEAFENGIQNYEKYSSELQTLNQSLEILNNSKSSTDQLTTARNNLASTFDNLIVGYTDEGEAILANNEILQKQIDLMNKKISLARQEIITNGNAIQSYNDIKETIQDAQTGGGLRAFDVLNDEQLLEYDIQLSELYAKAQKEAEAYIKENIDLIDSNTGVALSWEQLSSAQATVGNSLILEYMDDIINQNITYDEVLEEIRAKLSDSGFVENYFSKLTNQTQNAVNSSVQLEKAYENLNNTLGSSLNKINTVQSDLASAHSELEKNGRLSQSTINGLINSYPQLIDYLNAETGQLELTEDTMRTLYEVQKQLQIAELEAAKAKLLENEERIKSNVKVAESEYAVAQASVMRTGYASDAQYYLQTLAALQGSRQELTELETNCTRIDTLIENINNMELDWNTADNGKLNSGISEYASALEKLDHQKRMGQLTVKEEIAALEELGRKYALSADEQMDLEYRIYTAKKQYSEEIEEIRSKTLQEQYTQIENLKSLGKLTSEQELEWLEKIRQKYKMNAEERIALEIKIYNLKQELKQNEINALDDLGNAITEALKNQYDEQRKAEQDRINESISAWDDWEKSTVATIQAEIDALDELEKEQESQSASAEYYRKSQELQLKIAYEKDDYQREQYLKELNRLAAEEEERLRKEQIEAQKEELRQQIEDVENTADERREALEEELDVINDNYDELTSALSLRAQAEHIIMQQSQEDIIALIQSYAPDYNLTGQSIGESLYNGFKSKVDDIYVYIEEIMEAILNYQNAAKQIAADAADNFAAEYIGHQLSSGSPKSTTINYTSNFNVPVQSPVQTKRAIESTASQLAAIIQQ